MRLSDGSKISRFCIGTGGLEENYKDDHTSIVKKYNEFIELGFNFFDSGSVYDNLRSIKIISDLFKSNKNKIFLNNKFHPRCSNKEDIIRDTENILRTLNIDCLDMLQSHWPNIKLPIDEIFLAFEKLKNDGKIKYYGLSNPFSKDLNNKEILSKIDSLQIETNTYQNNLEIDFNKLILGYSVFKYLKINNHLNNTFTFLDHLSFLIYKGVTPIIRTLDINKVKSLIGLEKININENKKNELEAFYVQKKFNLDINLINFPKSLKTFKSVNDAYNNTLNLNPSPKEIAQEIKIGNVIKPIKVTRHQSNYFILDGINRLWAHKILSAKLIECIIIEE